MEKKITRRDALKAIIAGSSGIVAAGFVPEKWLKPVVKSGVLPVHAQASSPTPTPDYIQGNYFDGEGTLTAFALVSSQPIASTDNQTTSSTKTETWCCFPSRRQGCNLYLWMVYGRNRQKRQMSMDT